MIQHRNTSLTTRLIGIVLCGLITSAGNLWAGIAAPARCAGQGELGSISLTDWEAGLGSWTVGTHDIADPSAFRTPDWEVVGSLPDSRPGMAAFVADLDIGDCGTDVQTGALTLDSPPILIPAGTLVPRISVDHWVASEFQFDGGNIKISVNGGEFNLIPFSAIEFNSYNSILSTTSDGNTNPLAGEVAFTGADNEGLTGIWQQSHITLSGIAAAGDTIQLRFDFGIDACDGLIGWYVDEVEVYRCSDELPPSDCGNIVIDAGEQCDDGNRLIGDGCSDTCQIESGWQCTDPTPAGEVADPSFEAGSPNPSWAEASINFDSPICDEGVCGTGTGSGPADRFFWAWFGGVEEFEEASLSQSVVFPATVTEMRFELEVSACDSASDYIEVLIDGNREFFIDGSSPLCGLTGYTTQSVDISAYADGASHNIEFHTETFAVNLDISNFFVDAISIPGTASFCSLSVQSLTLKKEVINDNGGSATASDWTLTASGPTGFSGSGPSVSSGSGFTAGTYDLSESGGPDGYSASAWVCVGGIQDDDDTVTLAPGEAVTCTIRNDDLTPTLTVVKTIVNDNAGTVTNPDAFGLKVDGSIVLHNASNAFDAGNHIVSEDGLPGYQPGNWGGDCQPDGTIVLALDQVATCTITNNDMAPAMQINAGHAGAWFNPETSGQGQFIDVVPEEQFMFISWFTFTDAGSDHPFEQHWFTAQGNYDGNVAELALFETLGGLFDDPQDVTTTQVGEVNLSFNDCDEGLMAYSFDEEGPQGEVPLLRVIPGSGNVCEQLSGNNTQAVDINAGMDGAWFDLNTSGQGFFIDVHPDPEGGNFIFVSWFTYGEDTASGQRWMTAQGSFEGSIAEIDVFETTGGSFNDPEPIHTVRAGTMSLDFTDCTNALLTYSLTDNNTEGDITITRVIPEGAALCEELAGEID